VKPPAALVGLASASLWIAFGSAVTPLLLPPHPAYRTVVVSVSVLLFFVALAARRAAFVTALVTVTASGFSALVFGLTEPAAAGPIVVAGYLAGSALREIYEVDGAPRPTLLPAWRALLAASCASSVAALVAVRTSYLLERGLSGPRATNVLGQDSVSAVAGIVSALATLSVAAGMHRAAGRLSAREAGRRAVDLALVLSALAAGGVALAQRLSLLHVFRAERWAEWGRAQATFTDPSAAGVAVVLLLTPVLSSAASGPALVRVLAAGGAGLLLLVLADAGSRAGFLGAVMAASIFALWSITRLAKSARPGPRRRVAAAVATMIVLLTVGFWASMSRTDSSRPVLVRRLLATFQAEAPSDTDNAGNRLVLYEASLALFREHPVVGIGFGRFRSELPNAVEELLGRRATATDHPPSLYLGTLVESGLAGVLILSLLLVGVVRGITSALSLQEAAPEDALRAAGAASALAGLLLVFLFGSHLVYTEIAALVGVLTVRLPLAPDGRTARLLGAVIPVVLAGALVLLLGGVLARGYETRGPESAFRYAPVAGLYSVEHEPDGRAFRWTGGRAAFQVTAAAAAHVSLPVKNARPDGAALTLTVRWNDVVRGRVTLPRAGWKELQLAVDGPGVLRLDLSSTFRPLQRYDARRLGIEVGDLTSR